MCAQLGNPMCRLAEFFQYAHGLSIFTFWSSDGYSPRLLAAPGALRTRRTAPSISLCVSRVSFSIRSLSNRGQLSRSWKYRQRSARVYPLFLPGPIIGLFFKWSGEAARPDGRMSPLVCVHHASSLPPAAWIPLISRFLRFQKKR